MTVGRMGGNFPNRTGDNTEKYQIDETLERIRTKLLKGIFLNLLVPGRLLHDHAG